MWTKDAEGAFKKYGFVLLFHNTHRIFVFVACELDGFSGAGLAPTVLRRKLQKRRTGLRLACSQQYRLRKVREEKISKFAGSSGIVAAGHKIRIV